MRQLHSEQQTRLELPKRKVGFQPSTSSLLRYEQEEHQVPALARDPVGFLFELVSLFCWFGYTEKREDGNPVPDSPPDLFNSATWAISVLWPTSNGIATVNSP